MVDSILPDLSHLDIKDAFAVADLSPRGDPETVVAKGCCGQNYGAVCPVLLEKASGIIEMDPDMASSDELRHIRSTGDLSVQENSFLAQIARLTRAALSSVTNAILRHSQYHIEIMEDEDGMLIQRTMVRFHCTLFGRKFQTSWRPGAQNDLHGNAVCREIGGSGNRKVYLFQTIIIDAPTCEWEEEEEEDTASDTHSYAETTKDAGPVLLALANHSDFSWSEGCSFYECQPICVDRRQDFVAQYAHCRKRNRPTNADHLGAGHRFFFTYVREGGVSFRGYLPGVDQGVHFRKVGDVDKALCVFECHSSSSSFSLFPTEFTPVPPP